MLDRVVLRDRLEDDEDHDDLADGRDEQSGRAEEPSREYTDHGCRDQLTDEDQQQDRVQELLGRLGEFDQGLRAVAALVSK